LAVWLRAFVDFLAVDLADDVEAAVCHGRLPSHRVEHAGIRTSVATCRPVARTPVHTSVQHLGGTPNPEATALLGDGAHPPRAARLRWVADGLSCVASTASWRA